MLFQRSPESFSVLASWAEGSFRCLFLAFAWAPVRFDAQTFFLPVSWRLPWMESFSWLIPAPADFTISWFQLNENASYSHRTAQRSWMGADLCECSLKGRQWQITPSEKVSEEKSLEPDKSHPALPLLQAFSVQPIAPGQLPLVRSFIWRSSPFVEPKCKSLFFLPWSSRNLKNPPFIEAQDARIHSPATLQSLSSKRSGRNNEKSLPLRV